MDQRHYVPILKCKDGEFRAIRDLAQATKDALTPVMEVQPIPWDYVNDTATSEADQYLTRVAQKCADYWGTDRPLLLDIEPGSFEDEVGGMHPLAFLLGACRQRDVDIVPVTGLDRPETFHEAVTTAAEEDELGVCLRVVPEDLEREDFADDLDELIDDLGVTRETTDLLLDLGPIMPVAAATSMAARAMISATPYVQQWRSLILAATAFPENLQGYPPESVNTRPRTEWLVWRNLVGAGGHVPRRPSFSDYAIAHPSILDMDPRIMRMSANLRYTSERDWLILKGRDTRQYGHEQFNDICAELVQRPEFSGADFSWGDNYIQQCANGNAGPGNAMTWRRAGTSHHLTFVVRQIANLAGI